MYTQLFLLTYVCSGSPDTNETVQQGEVIDLEATPREDDNTDSGTSVRSAHCRERLLQLLQTAIQRA